MDKVAAAGTTALTQAYISSKKEDMKDSFDVEAGNLLSGGQETFEDEVDDNGEFWVADKTWTYGVIVAALGTVGLNVFLMVVYSGPVIMMAGIISTLVAVGVAGTELQLEDMDSLRQVHNRLRKDVNEFSETNTKLTKNVDELQVQVFCFKETEERLKEITNDQELNVSNLVKLVNENKETLMKQKKVVLEGIEADLMETILKADRDDDGTFSEKEVKRLIIYMRGLPAVEVNEELLKQALNKRNCIVSIMTLVQDVGNPGDQEGDLIFHIDTDNEELREKVLG